MPGPPPPATPPLSPGEDDDAATREAMLELRGRLLDARDALRWDDFRLCSILAPGCFEPPPEGQEGASDMDGMLSSDDFLQRMEGMRLDVDPVLQMAVSPFLVTLQDREGNEHTFVDCRSLLMALQIWPQQPEEGVDGGGGGGGGGGYSGRDEELGGSDDQGWRDEMQQQQQQQQQQPPPPQLREGGDEGGEGMEDDDVFEPLAPPPAAAPAAQVAAAAAVQAKSAEVADMEAQLAALRAAKAAELQRLADARASLDLESLGLLVREQLWRAAAASDSQQAAAGQGDQPGGRGGIVALRDALRLADAREEGLVGPRAFEGALRVAGVVLSAAQGAALAESLRAEEPPRWCWWEDAPEAAEVVRAAFSESTAAAAAAAAAAADGAGEEGGGSTAAPGFVGLAQALRRADGGGAGAGAISAATFAAVLHSCGFGSGGGGGGGGGDAGTFAEEDAMVSDIVACLDPEGADQVPYFEFLELWQPQAAAQPAGPPEQLSYGPFLDFLLEEPDEHAAAAAAGGGGAADAGAAAVAAVEAAAGVYEGGGEGEEEEYEVEEEEEE